MLFSVAQSNEFFAQWRAYSIEVLKHFGLPTSPGYKTCSWKFGVPKGITEHYTAGVTWKGSVQWLQTTDNKNSSCHAFINDRHHPDALEIQAKYPALKDLQVLALLMADVNKGTWHATWSNSMNFGIENRNAGILSGQQEDWRWWGGKFDHVALGKMPINIDGVWLEPYTYGQIAANVIVGQHLHCLLQGQGGLDPVWCLPHSCFQKGKRDTHKAFPLQDWRLAVFNQTPWDSLPWLQAFKADPQYMLDYEEEMDELFLQEMADRQGDRADDDLSEDEFASFQEMPTPEFQALIQEGNWKQELNSVRRALEKLGYVTGGDGEELDAQTKQSVWMFQKMMDLSKDGVPGDKETQPALYERLKTFQLVS